MRLGNADSTESRTPAWVVAVDSTESVRAYGWAPRTRPQDIQNSTRRSACDVGTVGQGSRDVSGLVRRSVVAAILVVACFSHWATDTTCAKNAPARSETIVLSAARLYVGDGRVIDHGMVIVRGGRIAAVGQNLAIPEGAKKIRLRHGSLTPGLIDADASVAESGGVMLAASREGQAEDDAWVRWLGIDGAGRSPGGCCGLGRLPVDTHVIEDQDGGKEPLDSAGAFAVGTRSWQSLAEGSSEVTPELRVIDSINLRSPDFDRLAVGGVTTVFASPDSAAVISARGAILHTGGPVEGRIMRAAQAVMATMGTDPSWRGRSNGQPSRWRVDFHARRPTTRMGVVWVFRKAMLDAADESQGVPIGGADTPDPAALAVLRQVRAGDIPLRIQARQHHDILAALRLTDEFGLSFVLEEATDAYKCLTEIKQRHVPVIFGPIYINAHGHRASSTEVADARLYTFKALLDAGIETALTAQELRDEDGLARQAMYAMRFGLSREQVLKAVTVTPAHLLGIDQEVGTLEVGKRGDVVLWTGEPFDATSRPAAVLVGGKLVVDRRKS